MTAPDTSVFVAADLVVSLDGFAAGPNQSLENPFGEGVGERLHGWMFNAADENADELAALNGHAAYVMGRNMFGPGRGKWNLDWRGWWGEEPPYNAPVFVLTHFPREPLELTGTTFTFVTGGPEAALEQAKAAAAGKGSVGIAGGPATVRQYLRAGAIDELRLHVVPVVLGAGENLFTGLEDVQFEPLATRHTPLVTHLRYRVVRS